MAALHLTQFGGLVSRIAPDLLKDELATAAENVRTDSGKLAPFRGTTSVFTLENPLSTSIYYYPGDNWFEWVDDVNAVKSPTAYDVADTVVYTGDDYPRITRNDIALGAGQQPVASYRLGIPAPTTAPIINETVASGDANALEEDRYYIYTFVDAWGREGPPSSASAALTTKDGATIRVQMGATPSGNHNFGAGALRRIYRTNTGTQATEFQFVAEIPIATTLYDDSATNATLSEVLLTATWDGPPDDDSATYPSGPMVGLTNMSNGLMAGFTGNTLCFCEPYVYHAWPIPYRRPVPDDIVALVPISAGLVVLTKGRPWLALGTDPSAIAMQELDENQACVSKRSAVDMGEYAAYASPDGLMAVEGGSVTNLTEAILTAEQWQAYNPSQLRAFRYENKYVAFNDTGGFIFTPGQDIAAAFMPVDFTFDGGHYDYETDTLYLITGGAVHTFDTGSVLTYQWKSKQFVQQEPIAFSCIQVKASSYPVSVTLTSDGTSTVVSVPDGDPSYLPEIDQAYEWSIEVNGTATVSRISLATSFRELARV